MTDVLGLSFISFNPVIGWWNNRLLRCAGPLRQRKKTWQLSTAGHRWHTSQLIRNSHVILLNHRWTRRDTILPRTQKVDSWEYLVNSNTRYHPLPFCSKTVWLPQTKYTCSLPKGDNPKAYLALAPSWNSRIMKQSSCWGATYSGLYISCECGSS